MLLTLGLALLTQTPSTVQRRVEAIRDDFAVKVARCGRSWPKSPEMIADTRPAMIFFNEKRISIHYPIWSDLPAETRSSLAAAAADAPRRPTPEAHFAAVFQRFLIAHELGHYLEILGGRKLSWWESEYQANRVAVAYWRLKDGDRAVLRQLKDYWTHESKRPSPAPAGADLPAFFNRSTFDPATYGWWQAEMTRRAWQARRSTSFCALVKDLWPAKRH